MTEMTSSLIGIDHMAIMYSVPFGLLGWGYVTVPYILSSIRLLLHLCSLSYNDTLLTYLFFPP